MPEASPPLHKRPKKLNFLNITPRNIPYDAKLQLQCVLQTYANYMEI